MATRGVRRMLLAGLTVALAIGAFCGDPDRKAPVAMFSYSVNGRTVQFTDQSRDDDGRITTWDWSFGDDSTSHEQNPIHNYAENDSYEVTLAVSDDDGLTDSRTEIVPTGNLSPVAAFAYSIDGNAVSFVDESTDQDGAVESWDWNFGDGSPHLSLQNPIHLYTVAGQYEVVLAVTDDMGASDTTSQSVDLAFDYVVYSDSGIPSDAEIWTWSGADWGGPAAYFDGNQPDETAPEGAKVFRTASGANWNSRTNYAGWGDVLIKPSDHTVDLSEYRYLRFWVKTPENLKVEIQKGNRYGSKYRAYLSSHGWDGAYEWREITIPATAFSAMDFQKVFCPFMVTVEQGGKTFYVDDVRWTINP